MSTSQGPSPHPELENRLRALRTARGWSQQELADAAGLSRTGISAIEAGRVSPSTAASLALARVLECRVEDLFSLPISAVPRQPWAWPPIHEPGARYWLAEVGGTVRRYPAEATRGSVVPHDGIAPSVPGAECITTADDRALAQRTLVIAGCDPAVGILVSECVRQEGLRVIAVARASSAALDLVASGVVHAAGIHLGDSRTGQDNLNAVISNLGRGPSLLHVTDWEQGIAIEPTRRFRSFETIARAKLRWISRPKGSGARQCLDSIVGHRAQDAPVADHHHAVCAAIQSGFADAGICPRLVAEESSLQFVPVRTEPYDLVVPPLLWDDPRVAALIRVVQSPAYRQKLAELPGYSTRHTGTLRRA